MLELTFQQIPEDLIAFNYHNAWAKPERARQRNKSRLQVMGIALLAIIVIRLVMGEWDWSLTGLIGGAALIYVLAMDFFVKMRVKTHIQAVVKKAPEGVVTGARTWQINDQGITVVLSQGDQFFKWGKVRKITETGRHWMLYLDGKEALVLPNRALDTPEKEHLWKELLSRHIG